ncbi:MAG: hypothetical protein MZU91_14490 [Desulfosudis oleivorans]|nr:hypothetical protein [Desulfosudis oleivorans]
MILILVTTMTYGQQSGYTFTMKERDGMHTGKEPELNLHLLVFLRDINV